MKVYILDGSPESFFTAAYSAVNDKNAIITSQPAFQLSMDSEPVRVYGDENKCNLTLRALNKYDRHAAGDIVCLLKSCNPKKEQIALEYMRRIAKEKRPIKTAYSFKEVAEFSDELKKVTYEVHRMKGFLRFAETVSGVFYAPYTPDNDITEMLMPHFCARFSNEKFIIHDVNRKIVGIYNGQDWVMGYAEKNDILISQYENGLEKLWKKYYKAVTIQSRLHEKQMKSSMPVRYWKFLPEKRD